MVVNLSELEEKLLRHIARHVEEHGYQPSYREIADSFGWSSCGYIATLVAKMGERGIVTPKGSRAVAFRHKNYLKNRRARR